MLTLTMHLLQVEGHGPDQEVQVASSSGAAAQGSGSEQSQSTSLRPAGPTSQYLQAPEDVDGGVISGLSSQPRNIVVSFFLPNSSVSFKFPKEFAEARLLRPLRMSSGPAASHLLYTLKQHRCPPSSIPAYMTGKENLVICKAGPHPAEDVCAVVLDTAITVSIGQV